MPTIVTSNPMAVLFDVRPTYDKFRLGDLNGIGGVYVADSVPASGVKGNFTITAPDGTIIYNNTSFGSPDYVGNVSYYFTTVTIPTNADGSYVLGTYTIVMRTQITDGVHTPYVLTYTGTYDFEYVRPTVSITQTIDCISPLFTSVDTTDYGQTGESSKVVTRTHSIVYPPGSAGAGSPVTGSAATLTTSTFYNGPQSTTISTDTTYTFASSSGAVTTFGIRDVVTGVKYITVDCTFICSISCCLTSLYDTVQGYRGTNNVLFEKYNDLFKECMSIVTLALTAISCGNADQVSDYLTTIQTIANCTDDCCGSDTPSLVTGLAGSGVTVVVESGGSPVTVTSATVGDTTTYTITLSSAFVSIVNSSYNTTITSNDSSVTVTTSGSNPKNYDLSVNLPTEQNRLEFNCLLEWANPVVNSGSLSITVSDEFISGSNMQNPTVENPDSGDTYWLNHTPYFKVSDFQVTPNTTYKVTALATTENDGSSSFLPYTTLLPVEYSVMAYGRDEVAGEFYFKFILTEMSGTIMFGNGTMAGKKLKVTLVITE